MSCENAGQVAYKDDHHHIERTNFTSVTIPSPSRPAQPTIAPPELAPAFLEDF